MKRETVGRIFQAVEDVRQQMQLEIDLYKEIAGMERYLRRYGMVLLNLLQIAKSKKRLRWFLINKMKEPSPEELNKFLAVLGSAPALLRTGIVQYGARLPRPKQGRRPAVAPEEAEAACAEVYTLISQGHKQAEALQVVRQKHGIEPRTMYRLWASWQEARKFSTSPLIKRKDEKQ